MSKSIEKKLAAIQRTFIQGDAKHLSFEIVYDRRTGEPFRIIQEKNLNGLKHFILKSEMTPGTVTLSEQGIALRFTNDKSKISSLSESVAYKLRQKIFSNWFGKC